MMKRTLLLLASASLFASCGDSSETASVTPPAPDHPEVVAVLEAPIKAEPVAIHSIRDEVQPGDEITVKGQIMGSESPFVEGRAAFILGDRELLTPCNEIPDDPCKTPWDVCCETRETIRNATATIQIVNADGRVVAAEAEGVRGLDKLAKLVVTGTVAPTSTPESFIINATAIRVEK